ncbi:MAG: 50S ribosomal protein L9 [Minisyncoccota bacterium]
MKVILLEDVQKLGRVGEVKEVKTGYGLNFLLPAGLAELATPHALRQVEQTLIRRRAEQQSRIAENKAKIDELSGKKVMIKAKGKNEKLFGSVGRQEIIEALMVLGVMVDGDALILEKPFKNTGVFAVPVDFGNGVRTSLEVSIETE